MELKTLGTLGVHWALKLLYWDITAGIIALALYDAMELHAASGERLYREKVCTWAARESVMLFDAIKENPDVVLNGLFDSDETLFEYVRQWVRDGKSREELAQSTRAHCLGEEI